MGYSKGRRLTDDVLEQISKKYMSRSEFQKSDSSAYSAARKRGNEFLDKICSHMVVGNFSIPQLIVYKIFQELFKNSTVLYNTRKIITPFELDVYLPDFKLAIEYNGFGWHSSEESKARDLIKLKKCQEKQIQLIIIKETSRKYEEDIKTQLCEVIDKINKICNTDLVKSNILNLKCDNIYNEIMDFRKLKNLDQKINQCSNIAEFQLKFKSTYSLLMKSGNLHLLERIKVRRQLSNSELLERCRNIKDYNIFIKRYNNLYQLSIKRNLLKECTSHMKKINNKYKYTSSEILLEMAATFRNKSHIKNTNSSLFHELKKRNIFDKIQYFKIDNF
jgi:hypothetical protein